MHVKYNHACLNCAPCCEGNYFIPSNCEECKDNFAKANESITPNEWSKKIVRLVGKIMVALDPYLGEGECIMSDQELGVYGFSWLKNLLYKPVQPIAGILENGESSASASPGNSDGGVGSGKPPLVCTSPQHGSVALANSSTGGEKAQVIASSHSAPPVYQPGLLISSSMDPAKAAHLGLVASNEGYSIPIIDPLSSGLGIQGLPAAVNSPMRKPAAGPSTKPSVTGVENVLPFESTTVSPSRSRPVTSFVNPGAISKVSKGNEGLVQMGAVPMAIYQVSASKDNSVQQGLLSGTQPSGLTYPVEAINQPIIQGNSAPQDSVSQAPYQDFITPNRFEGSYLKAFNHPQNPYKEFGTFIRTKADAITSRLLSNANRLPLDLGPNAPPSQSQGQHLVPTQATVNPQLSLQCQSWPNFQSSYTPLAGMFNPNPIIPQIPNQVQGSLSFQNQFNNQMVNQGGYSTFQPVAYERL